MGNVATKERSRSNSVSSSQQGSPSGSRRRSSVVSNGFASRRNRNDSTLSQDSARLPKSKGKSKKTDKEEVQNLILDPSEMVDGGYLQPQGVYTGPQDFKYKVVRELIIDRKLAPFYKGLSDYSENWSDRQLLAAVRGLPFTETKLGSSVPSPVPDAEPIFPVDKDTSDLANDLQNTSLSTEPFAIPEKPALSSVLGENAAWDPASPASVSSANSATEDVAPSSAPALSKLNSFASTATFPESQESGSPSLSSSPAIPFPSIDRPPATTQTPLSPTQNAPTSGSPAPVVKTQQQSAAAPAISPYTRSRANTSSRYGPSNLPNRLPQEIILYKEAIECPICFLFYPKLINLTRCCAQPICTECFVQIKRADPHMPHDEEADPNAAPEVKAEGLISEAACCPYCMMPEMGVTFTAPPYRTGIGAGGKRHNSLSPLALFNSSTSSVNSRSSQAIASASEESVVVSTSSSAISLANPVSKRRGSLPATNPDVITTDQIRPDWKIKLASARAKAARRSAAATALHASAFMPNESTNGSSSTRRGSRESKSSSKLRFGRLAMAQQKPRSGSSTSRASPEAGSGASGSGRVPRSMVDIANDRVQELEDMMFMEAVELSMREEEERQSRNPNQGTSNGVSEQQG